MCTMILLRGVLPSFPLVVAANRDEWHARPAEPPQVLVETPRVVAGRDAAQGGTWMGATGSGLFVGVTNQRTAARGVAPRSRGQLVLEALRAESVAGVRRLLDATDPASYLPYNLAFGDASELHVAYGRPGGVETQALAPGVHVLLNDRLGSPVFAWKEARVRALVAAALRAPGDPLLALASVLRDHEMPPIEEVPEPPPGAPFDRAIARRLQAICIHADRYGTRSSTLLALEPGRVARYLYRDGPACTAELADVSGLLR